MRLAISSMLLPAALAALLMVQGCAPEESATATQPAATPPPAATAAAESVADVDAESAASEAEDLVEAEETTAADAEPATEEEVAEPVAAAAAADLEAGKKIYGTYCTTCHGTEGAGDGPASAGLNPKPANFVTGEFKFDVDGNGVAGDVEDIKAIVHDGAAKHGGSPLMAPWPMIGPDDLQAVAEYVKSLHIS